MTLVFQAFTGKRWDVKRWQPEIFLADENDYPFSIPQVDGALIQGDMRGRERAALHCSFPVASFGQVTLPTGLLAPGGEPYNLNVEIARERLRRLEEKRAEWEAQGFTAPEAYHEAIAGAREIFSYTDSDETQERKARWADLSLSYSMPAGEELALSYARWGCQKRKAEGGFDDFLLGCNFFGYPSAGEKYIERFKEAFNYATMPFYWGRTEPVRGRTDYASLDAMEAYLTENGIKKKGHPLFWLLSNPQWLDVTRMTPEQLRALAVPRIHDICAHFKGRVEYYDIINEMHNWNIFEKQDMYDFTRMAAQAVRDVDGEAKRVVNINEPFSEYMARDRLHFDRTMVQIDVKKSLVPAEEYIKQVIENGIDFEAIGIQMYFGAGPVFCRDLFEISRFFDKFAKYGKEVHLTEMGVPSAEGEDENDSSHRHNYSGFTYWRPADSGFWHGPWTPRLQAEFIEGYYTILMGKPFVKAITYWDFTDARGVFFSHSGILDENNDPKPAFETIVRLRKYMNI